MNDNPSDKPNAKILFSTEYDDDSADVETLWAYDLGNDRYRIDNLPYFAYGVSWNDVVYAPFNADEQRAAYVKVLEKSGNRTIRIIFEEPIDENAESMALLDRLTKIGCDFENANGILVVINIPATVDLFEAAELIENTGVTWEYADPTYEEIFGDDE